LYPGASEEFRRDKCSLVVIIQLNQRRDHHLSCQKKPSSHARLYFHEVRVVYGVFRDGYKNTISPCAIKILQTFLFIIPFLIRLKK
jgi:hypothetical protein